MHNLAAVILAAGQGTRMRSDHPKVLHEVLGRPMVLWSLDAARGAGAERIVLVIGVGADQVRDVVGDVAWYALQEEQLGTGHATLQARDLVQGKSRAVLVLYADMPTLRPETLQALVDVQRSSDAAVAMLTVHSEDSMGFGRIVRDEAGEPRAIVEEAVASPEVLALTELNCGIYCFDAAFLWEYLPKVEITQPKGEYYLTDMVELAVEAGRRVVAHTIDDVSEVQGINTRAHLARAAGILRGRVNERLMSQGVTLVDPATVYAEPTVLVGRDTVIHPNTHLQGQTVIGEGCEIGPNTLVRDSSIGDNCRVFASVVEKARMERGSEIGPFGHLRKGAHLDEGVHMGNFGEVKNAHLGKGTKMGHFSYVGDAEVGPEANIGAGTVTCNYDGSRKHRTVIGEGAFIGSGTMLVAPVSIGRNARTGAGSVVTRDVPNGTLAYGVPARPRRELEGKDDV
ncbi:MAG: bifunctional UDP-N-acetylglucosamine diphosphorylase/glucosamine-1-phosphate N-acetyltransferase GlmU [Anaerolineae bacterium]